MPHFLDIDQIKTNELQDILNIAVDIKTSLKKGEYHKPMVNKQLAMIFEKPSTRTRASFEVGMNQLGGNSIIMHAENSQLGRGESIADTAQVLSRYVDIMMIRCFEHNTLLELAKHSSVPVINGLTDFSHPCQIMADILTFEEHKGSIKHKTIAWVGDSNNVSTSWIHAAIKLDFQLNIATPQELQPSSKIMQIINKHDNITWHTNPQEAVQNADCITTDTWVSMGSEDAQNRKNILSDYQVDVDLMSYAKPDAIFMHCLPAHRGDEVTDEVIDGKQSVVFDEAENRLHIQKAIIIWCLK